MQFRKSEKLTFLIQNYLVFENGFSLMRGLDSPLQTAVGGLGVDESVFQILDPAAIGVAHVLQTSVLFAKEDQLLLPINKVASKRFDWKKITFLKVTISFIKFKSAWNNQKLFLPINFLINFFFTAIWQFYLSQTTYVVPCDPQWGCFWSKFSFPRISTNSRTSPRRRTPSVGPVAAKQDPNYRSDWKKNICYVGDVLKLLTLGYSVVAKVVDSRYRYVNNYANNKIKLDYSIIKL